MLVFYCNLAQFIITTDTRKNSSKQLILRMCKHEEVCEHAHLNSTGHTQMHTDFRKDISFSLS